MKRPPLVRLTRESVIYGLGQAVARGLQMVLVPVFTRVFAPAEYGVIDVLALVATIAAMLIIMGTDAALARFFYEAEDAEARRTLVSTLAAWRLGLAVLVALVLWGFAPLLSHVVFASGAYAKYVRITAWSLPCTVSAYYMNDVLRLRFQSWKFIALNALNTLTVAGLSILFVVVWKKGVSGVLLGRLFGDLLTAGVGFILIRPVLVWRFSRPALGRLLAYSLPLIPTALAFWGLNYADRWVLVHYTNLTVVGIYAVAVKLSMLMVLVTSAFQLAWGPFAYAHAKEPEAGRTFSRVLTLFAGLASLLGLAIALFAPEALALLVPAAYRDAAIPGGVLVFGVIAYGGYFVIGIGANLAFRTDLQAWCSVAAAVITFSVAIALVRPLGLLGVALATWTGFFVSAVLLYIGSQRVYPLPFRGLRALALFGSAIALWAGAMIVARSLAAHGQYAIGLSVRILTLAAYALLALWLARRLGLPTGDDAAAPLPTPSPGG